MKIHKEGYPTLILVLIVLLLLNLAVFYFIDGYLIADIFSVLASLFLFGFFLQFFRLPKRVSNSNENELVCPADGEIVVIEETTENEYFKDKRLQVSIFMSPFNVHANWYPIKGTVIKSVHHSGRHIAAFLPKSSHENERSTVIIESEGKTQILVRQIAGALARRIVTYAHAGKKCHLNEHLGFIKFGSRVDLYFPIGTEIFVTVGESTTGNETIIARLNED